jgi:hypothetical protein
LLIRGPDRVGAATLGISAAVECGCEVPFWEGNSNVRVIIEDKEKEALSHKLC